MAHSARTTDDDHVRSIARWTVWAALAVLWIFLAGAMVSFDLADPPTHTIWPANDPVHNWCGPVGAWVAYHAIRLMGVGLWVPLI